MNYFSRSLLMLTLLAETALGADEYARVAAVRGGATLMVERESRPLTLGEIVPRGATIVTETRGFVRLEMNDGSYLNVAPSTRLTVDTPSSDGPDTWELVKGRIRSRIVNTNTGEEKLIIKTRNVALGVRGTEFIVSSEAQNGAVSLVTLEGSVAMARLQPGLSPIEALRGTGAVNVGTGNFSVLRPGLERPSPPRPMPARQFEQLKNSEAAVPKFNNRGVPQRAENITTAKSPNETGGRQSQIQPRRDARPGEFIGGAPGEKKGAPVRGTRDSSPKGMPGGIGKAPGLGKAPDKKVGPKPVRPGTGTPVPNGSNIPPPAGAPAGTGGLTGPISPSNPTTAPGAPIGPQAPGSLPPPPEGSPLLPPPPPPPPPPL